MAQAEMQPSRVSVVAAHVGKANCFIQSTDSYANLSWKYLHRITAPAHVSCSLGTLWPNEIDTEH